MRTDQTGQQNQTVHRLQFVRGFYTIKTPRIQQKSDSEFSFKGTVPRKIKGIVSKDFEDDLGPCEILSGVINYSVCRTPTQMQKSEANKNSYAITFFPGTKWFLTF
jgi:hypothetical protein